MSFNNVICFSIRWRGNNGNVYAILLIEFCCCCYLPTTASLVFEFYLYFNFACVCFCGGFKSGTATTIKSAESASQLGS